MKKTFLTLAIVFGISLGVFAQQGCGLFGMGPQRNSYDYEYDQEYRNGLLALPSSHGQTEDQTPLDTGVLLLMGFGAAYAMKKRQKH